MALRLEVSPSLLERARNGNADPLVAEVWPHAFRIAASILHDRTLAEDAAQESCAIAYRKIGALRSADAFRVWFYRIVVREAMRLERKRTLFEAVGLRDRNDCEPVLRLDVARALDALPPSQRAVVVLHYYGEMSSPEIAAIMGIADSSVRFHLMRAKRALETALADHRTFPLSTEAIAGAF